MVKVEEKPMVMRKKILPLVMALANKIIKKLNFVERINEQVEWDKNHWKISSGGLAKALILSTFTDMRINVNRLREAEKL